MEAADDKDQQPDSAEDNEEEIDAGLVDASSTVVPEGLVDLPSPTFSSPVFAEEELPPLPDLMQSLSAPASAHSTPSEKGSGVGEGKRRRAR